MGTTDRAELPTRPVVTAGPSPVKVYHRSPSETPRTPRFSQWSPPLLPGPGRHLLSHMAPEQLSDGSPGFPLYPLMLYFTGARKSLLEHKSDDVIALLKTFQWFPILPRAKAKSQQPPRAPRPAHDPPDFTPRLPLARPTPSLLGVPWARRHSNLGAFAPALFSPRALGPPRSI